jgi:predicted ATP-dependent protease
VYAVGGYEFGKPSRITASVGVGREGIINIERQVRLSGPIHDKGVLILSGYLKNVFARNKPLSLTASICFEQSYEGVEGDSASLAELLALLSAIGQVPLDQGIAVTGSVDQQGRVQPVGGINEKIEGFFDVCVRRGLTGRQGVIIPAANKRHLCLHPRVVRAVEEGQFHVYAVQRVEEAIAILTGRPAGEWNPETGQWEPPDSVFAQVDRRLIELARYERDFGKEPSRAENASPREEGN